MKDFSFGVIPFQNEGGVRRYLLVKHQSGHWAFPKGHAEKGETELESARREFEEETGVRRYDVLPGEPIVEHYRVPGKNLDKTVKYFLAAVHDAAVAIQEKEISEYAWLPYEGALERMTFAEGRKLLKEAESRLKKTGT